MNLKKKIDDRWLYLPIIVLAVNWVIRLIDFSKVIRFFPLDKINDISSYLAQLFFLDVCGYHALCNYWYNGFVTFIGYAPGWFFFTLPLYKLLGNVQIASYVSLILMFILSAVFIYLIGKSQKLSMVKIIAFFAFFFMNAINVGDFLRLGRMTAAFGWMVFLAFAAVIYYYRDRELDWKFFVYFILSYAILMISHPQETILGHFLLLGFFLVNKNKIKIILASIIGLILSSFWWVDYVKSIFSSSLISYTQAERLFIFSDGNLFTFIASFVVPIIFLVIYYFYWDYNKSKKETLFYLPVVILGVLYLLRVVVFIPVLNNINPDSYMIFFLFFAILLFFKTKRFPVFVANSAKVFLLLLAILSVFINVIHTPLYSDHTDIEKDVIEVLGYVEGKFLMTLNFPNTSYHKAYYSYAPIYYDLETASGWANIFVSEEYSNLITEVSRVDDCDLFLSGVKELEVTEFVGYGEKCILLNKCGWKEIVKKGNVCLYRNEM